MADTHLHNPSVRPEANPGKNIFTRTYWMVIAESEGKPTMSPVTGEGN